MQTSKDETTTTSFEASFPSSHKIVERIEHDGFMLEVPKRRIHLTGGEPPRSGSDDD